MKILVTIIFILLSVQLPVLSSVIPTPHGMKVTLRTPIVPVLSGRKHSPSESITIVSDKKTTFNNLKLDFQGTTDYRDIEEVAIYTSSNGKEFTETNCVGISATKGKSSIRIPLSCSINPDTINLWVGITLKDSINLNHKLRVNVTEISTNNGTFRLPAQKDVNTGMHRIGIALHCKGEEGVSTCRIPGIVTASDNSLIAIFDARRENARDLQGDIDIAFKRSIDGGSTWSSMHNILDMGNWGGLPQRYNGVSDACIVKDPITNRIFVAGLWMHGALDKDGKWIEGLDEKSTYWIHQWKGKGSQPGIGVKETCQFIIAFSDDNGITWSKPRNITAETKRNEWWLYAPAPGQGLALRNGAIIIPSQGRDENGLPFSNITYSLDHGETWSASNPAWKNVTECNAVELSNGDIMLNMRDNRNRGHIYPNGRRICVSSDLGMNWQEHPTSRHALVEPTCMASLYRHNYLTSKGGKASVLLFVNPDDYKTRHNLTLKASFDDGMTWHKQNSILFDETQSMGYSSITSVDPQTIGILYESGLADLVFIHISLDEIMNSPKNANYKSSNSKSK